MSSKISGMKNGLVSELSLLERMAMLVSVVPAAARGHADVRDQVATGDLVDICDLCCCWKLVLKSVVHCCRIILLYPVKMCLCQGTI